MAFPVERVLRDAQSDPDYLGHKDVASRSVWIAAPDGQSEVLVPRTAADAPPDEIVPTVLKMIVQLLGDKFYLTPDGHYNPERPMPWQTGRSPVENFVGGRGSVLLGPVPITHQTLHAEWERYRPNIESILRAVLPCVSKTGFYTQDGSRMALKLIHSFFEPRPHPFQDEEAVTSNTENEDPDVDAAEQDEQTGFDHTRIALEALEEDRDPQFRTVNVPTHPLNQSTLLEAARTHEFNPLCVFMYGQREDPIPPSQYGTMLPGATAIVTFTLSHRILRRPKNTSHFSATINEIEILERPTRISLTPAKTSNQRMFRKRDSPGGQGGSTAGAKRVRVA